MVIIRRPAIPPAVAIKPSQNCPNCWKGFYYDTLALLSLSSRSPLALLSLSSRSPLALLSLTLLVGGSFAARPAQAQNLVSNPGFETGAFADWTTTRASAGSDFAITSGEVQSGLYASEFGATGGFNDTISQNLSTIVGDNYTISFWLAKSTEIGATGGFDADFGSQTLLALQDSPLGHDYTQYTYTATATSASTALTFGGRSPSGYFYLDDISVTDLGSPVPEASSILSFGLLLALGLGGVVVAARKKRPV